MIDRPNVAVHLAVDIGTLLGLLNGEAVVENTFWIGDGFSDVNCRAPDSFQTTQQFIEAMVTGRNVAREKLRISIGQWIDSGLRKDGRECVIERCEERAPDAASEAESFWLTSRLKRSFDQNGSFVHPLPPEEISSFDHPIWKVRRCIAAVIDSTDLRFRIAKCRYDKCPAPYFVLSGIRKRVYEHGLFCSRDHHNLACAPRNSQAYRNCLNRRRLDWASHYVRSMGALQIWTSKLKRDVANYVSRRDPRRRVTIKWVTENEVDIRRRIKQAGDPNT